MIRDAHAFFSYVHDDDTANNGRLTEVRKRFEAEVSAQWGRKFRIFQDRDMEWGTDWDERIKSSLDTVMFLIPVVTPSYFNSRPCRNELERFVERERTLARADLILPFYFLRARPMEKEDLQKTDPLAQVLASRQYCDWRSLRFALTTSPEFGQALEKAAQHIVDALHRHEAAVPPAPDTHSSARKTDQAAESRSGEAGGPSSAASRSPVNEPPILIVDQMHRGDCTSIGEAIKKAQPGARIIVRPGHYREGLVIDKPLEIIGDGNRDDIVVEAVGADAVFFQTNIGAITNLTLRQSGGGNWFGIDIGQGRLDLSDCDVSSASLACIAIHDGADPRLRRNRIHDGKASGIFVYSNGQGTIEDNEIVGNARAGIEIKGGGDPVVRRNRIRDGKQGGILVHSDGRGTIEDNEIVGNALSGIEIKGGGDPVVRRNRIQGGKQGGIHVYSDGRGTIEDNEIVGNARAGILVKSGGAPTVRANQINDNAHSGVWIADGGAGRFEKNRLSGNKLGAKNFEPSKTPAVTWTGNSEE